MTARYFSDPAGNRQERITPFQKFDGNYLGIIYNPAFPDILTVTEKELLKLLNQYAFMDGKCYPRQTTLAGKLNCTTRQIRRLIKKLEQKGFIEVERPTLIDRHLFKQTSHYFFLWHPVYETFMSAEMSGEKAPGSLYINQQILKAPAVPTGFENLCNRIDQYPIRFSPVAFIGKYIKLFPVDAVKEALEALLKKLSSGIDQCFNAWGYAIAVIKRIGPNYNEAEYIKEARQFNEKPPTFEELEAKFADEEDLETYEPDKDLPDDVPTIAELRAMICGEDKAPEPEEPVEGKKLDIDQIRNQINQHESPFNPLTFIEHHLKKYTTDTITQVLQKVLDKMDMAAGVDKILLISFDFWQYGLTLINQMKVRDHDKPEEKQIRKELSQQEQIPEYNAIFPFGIGPREITDL